MVTKTYNYVIYSKGGKQAQVFVAIEKTSGIVKKASPMNKVTNSTDFFKLTLVLNTQY